MFEEIKETHPPSFVNFKFCPEFHIALYVTIQIQSTGRGISIFLVEVRSMNFIRGVTIKIKQ